MNDRIASYSSHIPTVLRKAAADGSFRIECQSIKEVSTLRRQFYGFRSALRGYAKSPEEKELLAVAENLDYKVDGLTLIVAKSDAAPGHDILERALAGAGG